MPQPKPDTEKYRKASNELLQKGILIALIGLAVLMAPTFMATSELRAVVASSYLVGWFALLLGAVLIAQSAARRWRDKPRQDADKR